MKTVLRDISLSKKSLGSVRRGMGRNAVRPMPVPRLFSMNHFAARIAGKYLGTENYTGFFAHMVLLLLKDGGGENAGRERHIHHEHFYYRYIRTVQMVYGSRVERIFLREFGSGTGSSVGQKQIVSQENRFLRGGGVFRENDALRKNDVFQTNNLLRLINASYRVSSISKFIQTTTNRKGSTGDNYHISPILPYAISRFVYRVSLALQDTFPSGTERIPSEIERGETEKIPSEMERGGTERILSEIQSGGAERIAREIVSPKKTSAMLPSERFAESRRAERTNRQYDTVSSHIWNMVVRQIHRANRTFLQNFSASQNAKKIMPYAGEKSSFVGNENIISQTNRISVQNGDLRKGDNFAGDTVFADNVFFAGDTNTVFKGNVVLQENLTSGENNISSNVNQKPLIIKQASNKEQFGDNRILGTEQHIVNQFPNYEQTEINQTVDSGQTTVNQISNEGQSVVGQNANERQTAVNPFQVAEQSAVNQILTKNAGTFSVNPSQGEGFIEKQIVGNEISNSNLANDNRPIRNGMFNGAEPTFHQISNEQRFAIWQMFGGKPSAIHWIVNIARQRQNHFDAFHTSSEYPLLVNAIANSENRNLFSRLRMGFGSRLNRMTGESRKKSIFPIASSVRRLVFRSIKQADGGETGNMTQPFANNTRNHFLNMLTGIRENIFVRQHRQNVNNQSDTATDLMENFIINMMFRQNVRPNSNQSILWNRFLPLNATDYSNLNISRNTYENQTFPRNMTNISSQNVAGNNVFSQENILNRADILQEEAADYYFLNNWYEVLRHSLQNRMAMHSRTTNHIAARFPKNQILAINKWQQNRINRIRQNGKASAGRRQTILQSNLQTGQSQTDISVNMYPQSTARLSENDFADNTYSNQVTMENIRNQYLGWLSTEHISNEYSDRAVTEHTNNEYSDKAVLENIDNEYTNMSRQEHLRNAKFNHSFAEHMVNIHSPKSLMKNLTVFRMNQLRGENNANTYSNPSQTEYLIDANQYQTHTNLITRNTASHSQTEKSVGHAAAESETIRRMQETIVRLEDELDIERDRTMRDIREVEELRSRVQKQEEELEELEKSNGRLAEEAERQREQNSRDPRVKILFDNEPTLNRQRYGAPLLS